MPTVAAGLAQSIESLMLRLPSWRVASLRSKRAESEIDASDTLAALIDSEVIPRLLIAHRWTSGAATEPSMFQLGADDVRVFAEMLPFQDTAELMNHLEATLARGISVDSLLIDLFAPAARVLGQRWDEDQLDFIDVTMGMWRLQELLHAVTARQPAVVQRVGGRRRALFAAMPGDQHVLGVLMVEECFRLAGWEAQSWIEGSEDALLDAVAAIWTELVGITVTQEDQIATASDLIELIRERSPNPALVVMVGGRLLSARPDLARRIGADGTAPDPRQAVIRAESLVGTISATTSAP